MASTFLGPPSRTKTAPGAARHSCASTEVVGDGPVPDALVPFPELRTPSKQGSAPLGARVPDPAAAVTARFAPTP